MYYQINIVGIKLRAPSPPNFCASKSQYYKYASSGVSKPNMCQFISDLNYSFRKVRVSVIMHFFFEIIKNQLIYKKYRAVCYIISFYIAYYKYTENFDAFSLDIILRMFLRDKTSLVKLFVPKLLTIIFDAVHNADLIFNEHKRDSKWYPWHRSKDWLFFQRI